MEIYEPLDGPVAMKDPEHLHIQVTFRLRERQESGENGSSANDGEAMDSRKIRLLVTDILQTAQLTRKAIIIFIRILCDRGGVVEYAFNTNIVALQDAGIPMKRFPVASNVSISKNPSLLTFCSWILCKMMKMTLFPCAKRVIAQVRQNSPLQCKRVVKSR